MNIASYFSQAFGHDLPDDLGAWSIESESPLGARLAARIDECAADIRHCRADESGYFSAGMREQLAQSIPLIAAADCIRIIRECRHEGNLYDYFHQAFGRYPADESLRQLLISDECGSSCRMAIDSARSFLNWIEYAFDRHDEADDLIGLCERTISCLWRG